MRPTGIDRVEWQGVIPDLGRTRFTTVHPELFASLHDIRNFMRAGYLDFFPERRGQCQPLKEMVICNLIKRLKEGLQNKLLFSF